MSEQNASNQNTPPQQEGYQTYPIDDARAAEAVACSVSGNASTQLAGACSTPAELADRYRFIRELGSGTQGKVFLAERLADNKNVAIKQLRIDSVKTWKEYTLFHREADVLATLNIPGVVKLYEACDYLEAKPPCSYIVQEYIEGMTLKQALSSGYRFSLNRAYDLILQLIDILEKLHTHNPPVIHRDIKPSNIILQNLDSDCFQVRLIDFGAVANPQVQSGGSTVAGTFGYMSPEQLIGRATPQSDTYALAALFAYIISGVDPADMKIQDLRLIIDPYVENHPVALVQTLRRMLEPEIENRLADLSELRKRFNDFKQGHYILENENYQRFSKQELITRLNAVKHLCQPQNLEIWQNLPDLPEKRDKFPCTLCTHPRFENYPKRQTKDNAAWGEQPKTTLRFSFLLLFIVYMLCLMPLACIMMTLPRIDTFLHFFAFIDSTAKSIGDKISPEFNYMYIIFIIVCSIPLLPALELTAWISNKKGFFGLIISKLKQSNEMKGILPWINSTNYVSSVKCDLHESIYKHGRKTIATITSIYFVPSETDILNTELYNNTPRIEKPPTFKIYYKFNPPDDNDTNDIIHSINTHRDPTELFKVGDPLPILYVTEESEEHVLRVTQSMPYPFPLEDLEYKEDYIGLNES